MISAIILAAGISSRMGTPKMMLPWDGRTVLGRVISVFTKAGIDDVLVITGGARSEVERIIDQYGARSVYNDKYASGEMISSLQCGLRAQTPEAAAILVGLGDQPQVQERTVRSICDAFHETRSEIIVPSFQMKRGHPWLVARPLWNEILNLKLPQTPRDFLNAHADDICYINVDDPHILADLDTPEDYRKSQP
jgi:molybdenum cofactor cytidylyltransferase